MMKLSHIVIMTVVAFALVFTGCDSAGAGGGGGSSSIDQNDGTVTVTLSGAAEHNDNWFYYAIYLSGAVPGPDDPLAYAEKEIASGVADGTELRARSETTNPWYAVGGTSYDLYAIIDMDGSGHSDGITFGDLLYQQTFTQDGDRTIATNVDDYAVYRELSLSATVTHTFEPGPQSSWEADFNHTVYPTRYYALIHEEEPNPPTFLDRDPDSGAATSDSFSLSTGVPADEDMGTATDWGFPESTPADVKLYFANVGMGDGTDGDQIAEGNFDVSNGHVEYYEYIYAAEDCTLSGTAVDGEDEYKMNDVQLSEGWNAIIAHTENGDDFEYFGGGTIDEAQWTLMK